MNKALDVWLALSGDIKKENRLLALQDDIDKKSHLHGRSQRTRHSAKNKNRDSLEKHCLCYGVPRETFRTRLKKPGVRPLCGTQARDATTVQ